MIGELAIEFLEVARLRGGLLDEQPCERAHVARERPLADANDAKGVDVRKEATEENFRQAAEMEMKAARALEHNKFKVELGKRAIARALMQAMNGGKA